MSTPGQAILWQIAWRSRFGLAVAAAYLLSAAILIQVLPQGLTIQIEDKSVPAVTWFFGISSLFVNVLLIAVFGMTGDQTRYLNYVSHMYVLPVNARSLVAWPMLSGCATVSGVWLLVSCLIFRPGGIPMPVWWPASALALFLAAFQALSWTPFAQRWLHVALTAVILSSPILVVLGLALLDVRTSDLAVALIMAGLIPLAYAAAVSGVGRARRGEPYDWQAWNRFWSWLAARRRVATQPFRSIHRAQLWFELRSQSYLVVFIGGMLSFFWFVPLLEPGDVGLGWRFLVAMLAAPLFVATMLGGSLGALHDPLSKSDKATFVLARPITSLSIVGCKLITAALVTAAIWVLMLAFTSLLLLRPGFYQALVEAASREPFWKTLAALTAVMALLIALTWKNMVSNLWVALTGRAWVSHVHGVGLGAAILAGGVLGLWIYFHPAWHSAALASVPWAIALAALAKLAAAALALAGLVHARLASVNGAAILVAAWCALVAACFAFAMWLVPERYFDIAQVFPAIVLLVPFVRLASAPLALDWNRHR